MIYHRPSTTNWKTLLTKIKDDLAGLEEADREDLRVRLTAIGDLQVALNNLFTRASGETACAACQGACCGCGLHHLTLTNLLGYLIEGDDPPAPDFSKTCPYLGENGCSIPVAQRPYNCITFFCEQLEESLGDEGQQMLRTLDRQLRKEYQAIADRYPAASLRGLWIAMTRVGDGQILISNRRVVVK
jgi:hypothetical protein